MPDVEPKEETPYERSLKRNGTCHAVACTVSPCEAFGYTRTVDGFRTCTCGHTQHVHAFGGAAE